MLNRNELDKLVRAVAETGEDEVGCEDCLERVDRFVELELAGLSAAAAMPLIQNHLDKCGDCREEFEALLAAVRAMDGSSSGEGAFGPIRNFWRRMRRGLEL